MTPPPGPGRSRTRIPSFSPRLYRWFTGYLERYFARNFTGVRVSKAGPPPQAGERPLIFYSNHPSWWDPVFFMLLGRFADVREGYGPMDAEMLEKYKIFKRLGIFGVEAETRRGAAAFLRTSLAVLEQPGSSLWLTAEGRFTDPRRRPVEIRAGIGHLARRAAGVAAVPLALEYPFWNERRPEALARFGEPIPLGPDVERSTEEWTGLFERRLEETMDALAREAELRDPGLFTLVVRGRTGIGGPYDAWRRLRAALRGERFRAAHGEEED